MNVTSTNAGVDNVDVRRSDIPWAFLQGEAWDSDTHTWSAHGHGSSPLGNTSIEAAVIEWANAGATIVGGCCRVGPAESARMRSAVDAYNDVLDQRTPLT